MSPAALAAQCQYSFSTPWPPLLLRRIFDLGGRLGGLGDTPLLRRVYDQTLGPPKADHSRAACPRENGACPRGCGEAGIQNIPRRAMLCHGRETRQDRATDDGYQPPWSPILGGSQRDLEFRHGGRQVRDLTHWSDSGKTSETFPKLSQRR